MATQSSMFAPELVRPAIADALRKLDPRIQFKNPVMFVTEVGALLTTVLGVRQLSAGEPVGFTLAVSAWLWFTVVFANFAEALAEGRGKAQAATLRKMRSDVLARRLIPGSGGQREEKVSGSDLKKGDLVVCEAGDAIPADGDIVEGVASVDESAITGESAPVIREAGGDRSAVTGGTKVLSDRIVIQVAAGPGEGFLDRMIALVEGASRRKTPNEIALHILLVALTLVFMLAVVTLLPIARYAGADVPVTVAVALLVCLIPTTIGGLLDKTGTITLGNRQATEFLPVPGVTVEDLADAAQLASLADETPEGRSIVVLAKSFGFRGREVDSADVSFVPFTAATRMSGCDWHGRCIRKGASDAVRKYVISLGGGVPAAIDEIVNRIGDQGGTPLVVSDDTRILGVIKLTDVVKGGIRERFARFRAMGIRTVMITGDNPRTAAAIAAEAGVDDFIAEATPEMKLERIRSEQSKGHMVAMTGDGTNDAPALAAADVGVAMGTGTQAAREAGNMVDLDSNPTKLLEIVEVGKQLLMTRGTLTTFSVANDVAKYFAILPALFIATFPGLETINVMHLSTPQSAILSAVIFNALIIVALIPLALRGVTYRPLGASALLRRNVLIYGVGGLIAPFVGIKAVDLILTSLHLA